MDPTVTRCTRPWPNVTMSSGSSNVLASTDIVAVSSPGASSVNAEALAHEALIVWASRSSVALAVANVPADVSAGRGTRWTDPPEGLVVRNEPRGQ